MSPLRRLSLAAGLLLPLAAAAASRATWFQTPLSPRGVNYDLNIAWDPLAKVVTGRETIRWTNRAAIPATELQFHLYQNAFSNPDTLFMRESGGQLRRDRHEAKAGGSAWGYEEVTRLAVTRPGGNAVDLTAAQQFGGTAPDGEALDRTVMRVALPEPLLPGETLVIDINFKTQLPKAFARSGWHGTYALVSQFFPKLGVHTDAGWNCHAYHANSEFFSEFGTYDVEIRAPRNLVIAAVGEAAPKSGENGQWSFHAEDVHDFAFAVDPEFKTLEGKYVRPDGRTTAIAVYHFEYHAKEAPRHLEAARKTLEFFEARVGAYPYPVLTVVIPPRGASGTGGMEYPTFVTSESLPFSPPGIRVAEVVVEHEVGHQWFQGMLASNEFEEPWLDEGLNQAVEVWAVDTIFGGMLDLYGMRMKDLDLNTLGYRSLPGIDRSLTGSWHFATNSSYGINVYSKPAVFMEQLRRQLGDERYSAGMREYYRRWAFKHPRSNDFIEAFSAGAGENLQPYFDTWLRSTRTADWKVRSARSVKREPREGWYAEEGGWSYYEDGEKGDPDAGRKKRKPASPPAGSASAASAPAAKGKDKATPSEYLTTVILEREGQAEAPVEWRVEFQDGSAETGTWRPDGRHWTKLEFKRSCTRKEIKRCRYREVRIDPAGRLVADLNPLNNRKAVEGALMPAAKAATRGGSLLMFMLEWMGGAL